LIAAALLERSCYGLEIDPRYVDVIVRRWEKITGRQARLADDGRTFEQVQAARKLAVTSLGKGNDHGATQI
jgi:DNA modification methylase